MTIAEPQIRVTGDKHDLCDCIAGDLLEEAEKQLRLVVNKAREEDGLHVVPLNYGDGIWEIYAYKASPLSVSYGLNSPNGENVWRRQVHL